jgi:hypothetical protein
MKLTNARTLALAACLMLTACASGMPPPRNQTAKPQANLMVKCQPLPKIKPGDNAVSNYIEAARLYVLCQNRTAGWIDWYGSTEESK